MAMRDGDQEIAKANAAAKKKIDILEELNKGLNAENERLRKAGSAEAANKLIDANIRIKELEASVASLKKAQPPEDFKELMRLHASRIAALEKEKNAALDEIDSLKEDCVAFRNKIEYMEITNAPGNLKGLLSQKVGRIRQLEKEITRLNAAALTSAEIIRKTREYIGSLEKRLAMRPFWQRPLTLSGLSAADRFAVYFFPTIFVLGVAFSIPKWAEDSMSWVAHGSSRFAGLTEVGKHADSDPTIMYSDGNNNWIIYSKEKDGFRCPGSDKFEPDWHDLPCESRSSRNDANQTPARGTAERVAPKASSTSLSQREDTLPHDMSLVRTDGVEVWYNGKNRQFHCWGSTEESPYPPSLKC
jgi:hypothetical protein